jgi:hypothetical protein
MQTSKDRILTAYEIKLQLIRIQDELMMLSNQPAWIGLSDPELELLRTKALAASDSLWYAWRCKIQ